MLDERRPNENNIADYKKDVSAIELSLSNLSSKIDSELEAGLKSCLTVLGRGVFRSFPPLTYDRMVVSGEANLVKSILLKDRLSAYGAFRSNYLQDDLKEFDKSTLDVLEKFSPFLDLDCTIQNRQGQVIQCATDKKRMREIGPVLLGKYIVR